MIHILRSQKETIHFNFGKNKQKVNMKFKLIAAMFFVLGFIPMSEAQVMTVCTPEQIAATNYRKQASAIVVRDTASQQLQTYYAQLATYYQQLDKDNQQKSKDIQQAAKDQQQIGKDAQQWECDKVLHAREAALNVEGENYDEVKAFIDCLIPILDQCGSNEKVLSLKVEVKRIHTNRSGQADGTNPGGQTHNINGFDNPGFLRNR